MDHAIATDLVAVTCYVLRLQSIKPKTLDRKLDLLSWNDTLGVFTFNLPAKVTCPGASKLCSRICYAAKGRWLCSEPAKACQRRYEATMDLGRWKATMASELALIAAHGFCKVRIHSSGDFYSPEYLLAWLELVEAHPHITFFGYTKTWRVNGWESVLLQASNIKHPNLHIMASWDDSMSEPPPHGWRVAITSRDKADPMGNCGKQLSHGTNCDTCGKCYNEGTWRVVFRKH